jgi:hypothetical protein
MNLAVWLPALFVLGGTGAAGVLLTSRHLRRFSWVTGGGAADAAAPKNSMATSADVHTVPDRRLLVPRPVLGGPEDSRATPRKRS